MSEPSAAAVRATVERGTPDLVHERAYRRMREYIAAMTPAEIVRYGRAVNHYKDAALRQRDAVPPDRERSA